LFSLLKAQAISSLITVRHRHRRLRGQIMALPPATMGARNGFFPSLRGSFQPDEVQKLQAAFDATWADIITHYPSRHIEADDALKHEISATLCAFSSGRNN